MPNFKDFQSRCPWHQVNKYGSINKLCAAISWADAELKECKEENCAPFYFVRENKCLCNEMIKLA